MQRRARHEGPPQPTPPPPRRTVNASCFAMEEGRPPHYVDVDHEACTVWKHYFGALRLCFEITHEGRTHQCCFVEYVWPGPELEDGEPLKTKYLTLSRKCYEVVDVQSVLYRAPLVTPPPLHEPGPGARAYVVLNNDIYINW